MKKLITGIILFSFLVFSLFAAGGKEDAAVIRVGVFRGPTGFGIIKVMENPPVVNDEISFEFEVLPGPTEMVAKVASGEVDIALFPVNVAAKLYLKGPGYKLGAIVGNGLLYLLSRDGGIDSIDDLDGKKVYSVGRGATPDYLFQYLAKSAGIKADVDFTYNNPTQLVQLYLAGEIDTMILPEPFATQVKLKHPGTEVVVDFQEEWKKASGSEKTYPISALVVSPEIAETHPETIKAFLNAYKESIDFVNSNPEEAGILIEKFGIFPQTLAVPAIPGCNLIFISAEEAKDDVTAFLQVLLDSDPVSIGGQLPDEAFYGSF